LRYYIADNHFCHAALNTKMDRRGFESVEEMNEYMIQRWNEKVRKKDEVIILGDFSWGNAKQTQEILSRLNGKLHLIVGNHDHFLNEKDFDTSRFVWIKEYAELSDNKRKVVLSHYPIACYNGQYRRNEQGEAKTYMLHGHIHNTQDQVFLDHYQDYVRKQRHMSIGGSQEAVPSQIINCFCMFSDYQPMSLDEWIEIDKQRREGRLLSQ
jgi:calcineurin-like phosphoesterase family protein